MDFVDDNMEYHIFYINIPIKIIIILHGIPHF